MRLLDALKIGEDCALETVGEALYNIDLRAGQIFDYDKINAELQELVSSWNTVKLNSSFTDDSSIEEVTVWITNSRDIEFRDAGR